MPRFLGIEHFSPPWDVIYLPLFNLLVLAYRLLFSDFALAIIVFTGKGKPHGEGGAITLVEVRHELEHLLNEGVGVRLETAVLGQLPDDDDHGQAVHVADLDLARQQVGDEAELADAEPDLDEADEGL